MEGAAIKTGMLAGHEEALLVINADGATQAVIIALLPLTIERRRAGRCGEGGHAGGARRGPARRKRGWGDPGCEYRALAVTIERRRAGRCGEGGHAGGARRGPARGRREWGDPGREYCALAFDPRAAACRALR